MTPDGLPKGVSLSEIARHLLLTREMVRRMVAERIIERQADGSFDVDAARQNYIHFLRDRRSERGAAEAALRRAKAREIELRIAERERQLIPFDDAFEVVDVTLGLMRSEIGGVPARITRDPGLRRQIDSELNNVLARVVEKLAVERDRIQSGDDATS